MNTDMPWDEFFGRKIFPFLFLGAMLISLIFIVRCIIKENRRQDIELRETSFGNQEQESSPILNAQVQEIN